nr:serine/arginine repetitive matrix protein 2-like [Ipomoea batatas]
MSDSDSQNVSAQDYDAAVEATPTDASSANSTGTAGEVGSHDGWVGEDGPRHGKSLRVVAAQYPPATREALLAELPPRPATAGLISVPHSLDLSSSQPSASSGEELVPLNSEDVRNHPCLLTLSELEETTALLNGRVDFQTKSVAAADLEPPDYSQPEKYVPKRMAGSSTAVPTSGIVKQGMVLERSFASLPSGPKKPRPKVTLGGNKAPLLTEVPPAQGAVPTLPASSAGTASAAELQVVRPASRRGKEKTADQEVEEIPPPKKQKRPIARGSTPVLDALREGGEHTASFIDKVRAVIPTREAIRDLDTDQVGEMIAHSVLWLSHMTNDLFCRAKAAENVVRKDVVPLRESLAAKDKELTEKVQALEARIASAELEVEAAKRETAEMNDKMSSYANLSGFLCRDPREAEAFFRAFIHKEVGEELAWRYGAWAHAKGRFEMQQAVREALEESLNEKDFATVMSVMPDPVPAPGPMPYADPAPGDDAPAPTKVRQRIDVLPHAPPTYLGLIAATGRKHSADEGTHYPQPRPLPSGSGEVRGTVLTGRGKGPTVSARIVRDGAPGVRDSAGFPGPGSTRAVERFPAGTGRESDNTGGALPPWVVQVGNSHGVHRILVHRRPSGLRIHRDFMDDVNWILRRRFRGMRPVRAHAGFQVGSEVLVVGLGISGILHLLVLSFVEEIQVRIHD